MSAAKKPNLAALACFYVSYLERVYHKRWRSSGSDVDFKSGKVLIRATEKGDDDRLAHMPSDLIASSLLTFWVTVRRPPSSDSDQTG